MAFIMSSLTKDKCSMGLNPWSKLSDFIIKSKKWPENNHMLPLVPRTSEKYWREGHSSREDLVKEMTLWLDLEEQAAFDVSVEGDGFGQGGSRIWLGGRRRSSEKNKKDRGPIAAGRGQCSSWKPWGWLIGHHEGRSRFALKMWLGNKSKTI